MKNEFCFDITTNVFINNKNIGYSEFDLRLEMIEFLKKIKNLEFTFGKAKFEESSILFKSNSKNFACIYLEKPDCFVIKNEYEKQQPRTIFL